jgi:heme/copper-type cytochrome/quinol oxidase subunit 2
LVARSLILVLLVLVTLGGLFILLRPNSPTAESQTQEFDLRISGEVMEPSDITVTEGDRVVLRITADSPLELHLHGYDLQRNVEPGAPARLSFEADLTGRFEVENHETEEELGTLVVEPR